MNQRNTFWLFALLFFGIATGFPTTGWGARKPKPQSDSTLRVGMRNVPPFVMMEDGVYSGISIDLWKIIEERLKLKTTYKVYPSFKEMLEAAKRGEIDVVVCDLCVTHDRTSLLKYTYPFYDSGLGIMIKSTEEISLWDELKRNGQLYVYTWLAVMVLIIALLITIIRKFRGKNHPKNWLDGFFLSIYDLILAFKDGVINFSKQNWFGYLVSAVWMLCGVGMVAYITSTFTATMATAAMKKDRPYEFEDLRDKKVAVMSGEVGEAYVTTHIHTKVSPYDNLEQAAEALENNQVDAIITDAPLLKYWCYTHPEKKCKVVNDYFKPEKYAFASTIRYDSEHSDEKLMDHISNEIIKMIEQGEINKVRDKYIGN